MADGLRLQISEVCSLLDVDGIRGDITKPNTLNPKT